MKEGQTNARIIMHPATVEYYNDKRAMFEIKPYSKREMAEIYDVCSKTFEKWVSPFKDEIGTMNGRYYTVRQVKVIVEKLDLPHWIDVA
jgi:transposase